ncbi:MAG: hypothetical protein KGL74_13165, partial [Elusimicrobia bacterium]|nr:hypothetical protein [Elusimicrobiota bacterium]
GANVDFISSGKIESGETTNLAGAIWFNSNANASGRIGANGANMFGIYNGYSVARPNWPLTVSSLGLTSGNVGINTPPSTYTLDVNGTLIIRDPDCNSTAYITDYTPGPNPSIFNVSPVPTTCPAGRYATWASGLMTYRQSEKNSPAFVTGSMLCCPCPNGNCVSTLPP